MNTGKKHFNLTRGNAVAGIREVSKGGRGGRLWHTILLARSSVLYLLLRPNKAIRSCGRACAVTSTDDLVPPFPNETRFAGLSFGEGVGSECGMQWSMSFRRNKRYIKNSNTLSFFIFDAVFLAPYRATEKHGNISCRKISRMKYLPVPPQRKCFQIASMFISRERKVIAK